jgi:AcrR family transcriptional regulator
MAFDLVIEGGLEALTIHRLARELDYTPGALYRYFPSKGAVLAELQRHSLEVIHISLKDHLAQEMTRPDVQEMTEKEQSLFQILAITIHYGGFLKTLPHHIKMITHLFGDPRTLMSDDDLARSAPAFTDLLSEVDGYIETAVKAKAIKGGVARQRALMLWSTVQGLLLLEKHTRIQTLSADIQYLCRELVFSLLLGWGASRVAVTEALGRVKTSP